MAKKLSFNDNKHLQEEISIFNYVPKNHVFAQFNINQTGVGLFWYFFFLFLFFFLNFHGSCFKKKIFYCALKEKSIKLVLFD